MLEGGGRGGGLEDKNGPLGQPCDFPSLSKLISLYYITSVESFQIR